MDPAEAQPGAVFTFSHDDRRLRVLARDGDVVMYDAWWPHIESWGLADLEGIRRRRVSYDVADVPTLVTKAPARAGQRIERTVVPVADELVVAPVARVRDDYLAARSALTEATR